jgi:hypothetical protein
VCVISFWCMEILPWYQYSPIFNESGTSCRDVIATYICCLLVQVHSYCSSGEICKRFLSQDYIIVFGLMISYEVKILVHFHACSINEWVGFQNFEL